MTDEAITELEPLVGVREACRASGRSQATHYRRHRKSPAPTRPSTERRPQPRALSADERAQVRAMLNSPEHVDKAPAAVYHELLDGWGGRQPRCVPTPQYLRLAAHYGFRPYFSVAALSVPARGSPPPACTSRKTTARVCWSRLRPATGWSATPPSQSAAV
jgi:hypothetical protein